MFAFVSFSEKYETVNTASANVMSVFITFPAPDNPANSNKFLFFCTSRSVQFEKENPQATTSHHNIPLTIAIATPLMKRVHEKHRTRSSDMPVNFFTWTAMSSYVFLYYLLTF